MSPAVISFAAKLQSGGNVKRAGSSSNSPIADEFKPVCVNKLRSPILVLDFPRSGESSGGGLAPHHWHFSHPVFVMTGLRVTEVPFVKYRTIERFCFQRTEFYRKSSEFKASEKLSLYLRAIENGQNTTVSPKVSKKVTIGAYKKRRLDFSSLPKVCINNFCSESSQAYPQTWHPVLSSALGSPWGAFRREGAFCFIPPQHESVYIVGGVFQPVLVQHPGALGKAHTRQPVVLCHDHIPPVLPVHQRKVHAVSPLSNTSVCTPSRSIW